MTDLSPNVEVVLTSDLFNNDPCLEGMSKPAWAVLDAYMAGWGWLDSPTKKDCRGVAAALRALAAGHSENLYDQNEGKVAVVRSDLVLAIATELENQ